MSNEVQLDTVSSDFDGIDGFAIREETPKEPLPLAGTGERDSDFDTDLFTGEALETEAQEKPDSQGEEAADAEEKKDDKPSSRVSIDVRRKQHEFNLDPEDETLRRTLRNGVRAQEIKAEADKLRAEVGQVQAKYQEAQKAVEVFNELKSLTEAGDFDQLVESVLGDQYEAFLKSKFEEFIAYQEATPEQRQIMDRDRKAKMLSKSEMAKDKRIKELESIAEQKEVEAQTKELKGYATAALSKVEFTEAEIKDPDLRHRLNKRLWRNSWDTIKEYGDKYEINNAFISKVFAHEAKLLKAARTGGVKQEAVKQVEVKKEEAKKQAADIATKNLQPKEQIKWDGKSAKDLWKQMFGR